MKWFTVSSNGQIIKSETYGFTQSFGFLLRGIHINRHSHYMYITPIGVQMAQPFWNLRATIQERYKEPWPAFSLENSALVYASDSFPLELVSKHIGPFWRFFSFSSFLSQHLRLEEVERHLWRSSPTRKDSPGLLPICLLIPPQMQTPVALWGISLRVCPLLQ